MDDFKAPVRLGRSGIEVGRLGVAGGYGAPAAAFEEAFERGCNYFYHGSSRRQGMNQAIKDLAASDRRERLAVVAQVYTRSAWHLNKSFESFLRKTGLEYADVILLGWYNSDPPARVLDAADRLKERQLIRAIAISGHNRRAFPGFADSGRYDILQFRYNAAHRGAETDIFPRLDPATRPGTVVYTATRWGNLVNPKRMPPDTPTPRASDCYRFALMNQCVDVCMAGPKDAAQMKEALAALDRGPMSPDEIEWMIKVGDHVHRQNPWVRWP